MSGVSEWRRPHTELLSNRQWAPGAQLGRDSSWTPLSAAWRLPSPEPKNCGPGRGTGPHRPGLLETSTSSLGLYLGVPKKVLVMVIAGIGPATCVDLRSMKSRAGHTPEVLNQLTGKVPLRELFRSHSLCRAVMPVAHSTPGRLPAAQQC